MISYNLKLTIFIKTPILWCMLLLATLISMIMHHLQLLACVQIFLLRLCRHKSEMPIKFYWPTETFSNVGRCRSSYHELFPIRTNMHRTPWLRSRELVHYNDLDQTSGRRIRLHNTRRTSSIWWPRSREETPQAPAEPAETRQPFSLHYNVHSVE